MSNDQADELVEDGTMEQVMVDNLEKGKNYIIQDDDTGTYFRGNFVKVSEPEFPEDPKARQPDWNSDVTFDGVIMVDSLMPFRGSSAGINKTTKTFHDFGNMKVYKYRQNGGIKRRRRKSRKPKRGRSRKTRHSRRRKTRKY